jgi:hypothetical protein
MGLDTPAAFYEIGGQVFPKAGIEQHFDPWRRPADLVPVIMHINDLPQDVVTAFDGRIQALCGDSATAGVYLAIAQPYGVADAALATLEGA